MVDVIANTFGDLIMYITNWPEVALIAEQNGVDRIFIDMEYIGKTKRQGDKDSVKNHHTVEDVKMLRKVITKAQLLVRVNPIHDKSAEYCSSEEEIEQVVSAGADIIMLPFFKTAEEVQRFLNAVNGRCRTVLLLETPEAVENLADILTISGIDEVHIGINDLSMCIGKKFMFEVLTDGTVEYICRILGQEGIHYGIGGIASPGHGRVPAELIIKEHYRLGSEMAILSRSFCDAKKVGDLTVVGETFSQGVRAIRELEKECERHLNDETNGKKYFGDNKKELKLAVEKVVACIS